MAAPGITPLVIGDPYLAAGAGAEVYNSITDLASPPRCSLYNSGSIGIATGAGTPLTWDSEKYDVGGLHSTSSNTSRITVPVTATYLFNVCVQITDVDKTCELSLNKNSAGVFATNPFARVANPYTAANVGQVATYSLQITRSVQLTAGDYVEAIGHRLAVGTNAATTTSDVYTYFDCQIIGYP